MVKKKFQKSRHDIKIKILEPDALVLMYDNKFLKNHGKLHMRWLGPFKIVFIMEVGATNIVTLERQPMKGLVNGSHLKPYFGL